MHKYFQGDSMIVEVKSDDFDFDAIDFAVWLYRFSTTAETFRKESMQRLTPHHYQFTVASTQSATWSTGDYFAEVVILRDGERVSIAKEAAFTVLPSASKGKL